MERRDETELQILTPCLTLAPSKHIHRQEHRENSTSSYLAGAVEWAWHISVHAQAVIPSIYRHRSIALQPSSTTCFLFRTTTKRYTSLTLRTWVQSILCYLSCKPTTSTKRSLSTRQSRRKHGGVCPIPRAEVFMSSELYTNSTQFVHAAIYRGARSREKLVH
jgi:hypothetical protein